MIENNKVKILIDKLNTIKVPRYIQELAHRINSFIGTLTMDELNELTNEYVAVALNVSKNDVEFAMQADRRKTTISFDDMYRRDASNLGYEEVISDGDYKEMAELEDAKLILELVIARLPKHYRIIIELYYYEDFNQKEIAERLGLNEMQVSRKIKKAFSLLHQMISDSQLGDSLMGV